MRIPWAEQSWTRQRRGIRLFEVALVIGLISVLVVVILHRLDDLHSKAERLAAQGVIRSLQGAVLVHTGTGKEASTIGPVSNPMQLLQHLPGNYLGELEDVQPEEIKGGQWYFDTEKKMLIYRVDNPVIFEAGEGNAKRISFSLHSAQRMQTGSQHALACGPVLCLVVEDEHAW